MRRPLCMACVLYILGILLLHFLYPSRPPSLEGLAGKEIVLKGKIYAKEIQNGDNSPILKLYLQSEELILDEKVISVKSSNNPFSFTDNNAKKLHFICNLDKDTCGDEFYNDFKIGQTVCIRGKLSVYEKATNPGQFDTYSYYAQKGIYGKLSQCTVLGVMGKENLIYEFLAGCRKKFGDRLEYVFGKQDGAVLKAILLGDKSDMTQELKQKYKDAGILHIFAISGLHISMLAASLLGLLQKLGLSYGKSSVVCSILLLSYGIMVGMPVSCVRAIFMFLYGVLAKYLKRTADGPTILSFSAAVILTYSPSLLFSPSFLFSFGAVCGIVFFKPALEGTISNPLFETLKVSFSVFFFLLPLQLYFYYEISVVGIFLNLGVIPLMSVLVAFGMLGLFTFHFIPFLGDFVEPIFVEILKMGVHGILQAYEAGCDMAGALHGTWILGKPKLWKVILFYVLVGVFLYLKRCRNKKHCAWLLVLAVLVVGIPPTYLQRGLRVTFLDVGQGDCICVELPKGVCYLMDGGSSSVGSVGKYRLIPYLKSRGIGKIDALFISHGDMDHINAMEELLEDGSISVKCLVVPFGSTKGIESTKGSGSTKGLENLLEMAARKKVSVLEAKVGNTFLTSGAKITILNPQNQYETEDSNNSSLAISVQYENVLVILTGDIEETVEERVAENLIRLNPDIQKENPITILKVAHHGSKYSTSEEFLNVVNPDIAIISCGEGNRYGHPHKETIERIEAGGTRIYRTDKSGAISVNIENGKVRVREGK